MLQGELAVGNGTVRISTTDNPCSRIWVGAPSTRHTKGSANTTPILIGKTSGASGGNASGGMFLDITDNKGFFVPVDNVTALYFTGFTAGDVVEYVVFA